MSKKSIPFVGLFAGGPGALDRAQQAYDQTQRSLSSPNSRMTPDERTQLEALRAELGRYLADPFHAAAIDSEKSAAKIAPLRSGGKPDRQSDKTKHIWRLATKNAKSAQWLYAHLSDHSKRIIGKMSFKAFEAHVGKARKNNPLV